MKLIKSIITTLLISIPLFVSAQLMPISGGTGTSSKPTTGDLLVGNSSGIYQILHIGSSGNCLIVSSGNLLWSSSCGSGGSGSGGTWSTTTSQVSGQLINYPNNNTDIVNIGSNSTTTGKFYFDPNLPKVSLLNQFIMNNSDVLILGNSTGTNATKIGLGTFAGAQNDVAIGTGASAFGNAGNHDAVAIGLNTYATNQSTVALGESAIANGYGSLSIGSSAQTSGDNSIAIGVNSISRGTNGISIGNGANSVGNQSISIGYLSQSKTGSDDSVAIGQGATIGTNNIYSEVIGSNAASSCNYCLGLGKDAAPVDNNEIVFGADTGDSTGFDQMYLGQGIVNLDKKSDFTINVTGRQGTDLTGSDLTFVTGRSTGLGVGGQFNFSTADAGSSGSNLNSTSTKVVITGKGLVGIGTTSPYTALSVVGSTGVVADIYTATNTLATSTFAGFLTTSRLDSSGSATNTSAQGWNITNGCYAFKGTCVSSGGGSVNSVTATAPLFSSGGVNPNITFAGISTTSVFTAGNLIIATGAGTVGVVATSTLTPSSPLSGSFTQIGSGGSLSINNAAADGSTKGASTFTASDFNDNGSGLISLDYTNGQKASVSQPGFLSTPDYNTFFDKVATGTSETRSNLAFWTSNSGTPPQLGSVGTSTLTASSPLTGSFTQVGSGGSLGCTIASVTGAGCISQASFNLFNGDIGTTSTLTAGNLLAVGNTGVKPGAYSVSTTSIGCSGFITCTGFNALGSASTITTTGQLGVASGGTAASTFGQGWIYSSGGTTALNSSTSPTVNYIDATSTTNSSFFPYASTTATSAGTLCLTSDICRTTWPTASVSGGSTGMLTSWTNSTTLTATGTPTFASFYATSTTATSTIQGSLQIGTTTGMGTVDVNGSVYSEMASTTKFIYDFCQANNTQNWLATTTNANVYLVNANKCIGKSVQFFVVAPASGVIGSTTFIGSTNSGQVIWDGGINPGNSVVNGSTDRFCFISVATSSVPNISADLCGNY